MKPLHAINSQTLILKAMTKGRPKGVHKTMISARLRDEAIEKLKAIENNYGVKKSEFINKAIIDYYYQFIKMNNQNYLII